MPAGTVGSTPFIFTPSGCYAAGSFVLLFEPTERNSTVRFLRLAHHDEA